MPISAVGEIYAIESVSQRAIKIGFGSDAAERLRQLQTGNPDKLVLFFRAPALAGVERALHAALVAERIAREWFRSCDAVTALLGRMDDEWADQEFEQRWLSGPPPLLSEGNAIRVIEEARETGGIFARLVVPKSSARRGSFSDLAGREARA